MGAKPINALNILAVTKEMTDEEIAEVIRGVKDILAKDNIPLKGGHTIISEDLLCGLSVSGIVNKKNIKLNNTAKKDDLIVISKPIGFGTLISAKSVNEVDEKDYNEAIK
ncbi:hypothetical protein Zmor_011802 [Zophobas morio]|uniref:PurM-like N-terminal domain-containing protein n=1 Tax=Zophobas morio TaxID=2755281 RepID=A0AA38HI60_9CUCU|nr:hypothetical protein Zmor_011802 [Zophobas morio]